MACAECQRLYKDCLRLQDYIRDQSSRHTSDLKALREDLAAEIKYSKKLHAQLDEEYAYCEKLRAKLSEKNRLAEDLREDLKAERAYSEKLERKLDKRAKEIKELEKDLRDVEDDFYEAQTTLKHMDRLRRELDDAKLNRLYDQKRVKQLQDEVTSLRSSSQTSSPYLIPASYATLSPRYAQLQASASPAAQTQVRILNASPRPKDALAVANTAEQRTYAATRTVSKEEEIQRSPPRRVVSPPPSNTPELESDNYSDEDSRSRLTEEDEEDFRRHSRLMEERLRDEEYDEVSEYSYSMYSEPAVDDSEPPETPMTDGAEKAPGQKLRELAAREARLADREYDRASEAYATGDKDAVKKLRDSGAQHRQNMRTYHRMAAAEIFNHHNPAYDLDPSSRTKIDLHHLFVSEAREYVERHLDLCRRARLGRTEIISGRGNHSTDGVPKIRPAILELLRGQRDVEVVGGSESDSGSDESEGGSNPGRIVVKFLGVDAPNTNANSNATNMNADASWENRNRSTTQLGLSSNGRGGDGDGDGPRHADSEDDVFETGQTRLKALPATPSVAATDLGGATATRGTGEVGPRSRSRSPGVNEIDWRMNAMRSNGNVPGKFEPGTNGNSKTKGPNRRG